MGCGHSTTRNDDRRPSHQSRDRLGCKIGPQGVLRYKSTIHTIDLQGNEWDAGDY